MTAIFRDFSGRYALPVERFEQPGTLAELRQVVLTAERAGLPAHAMGTGWAFSAPAYCPGIVVDTRRLSGFPAWVQRAVVRPDRGTEQLVAVEAGIKVVDLYRALDTLRPGRRLTPPTLGGAGGQSLAGVVSTATHGGDVARPPICDYVRAMLVVGSGGVLRLIQRPDDVVVDLAVLEPELRARVGPDATVVEHRDDDVFDAALVSVGRFGAVYAYVFTAHDESGSVVVEHRRIRSWSSLRVGLAAQVRLARAGDEFLQIVVNPVRDITGDHRCYETRHRTLPRAVAGTTAAGEAFGLGPETSTPVTAERARAALPAAVGQVFCGDRLSPELAALHGVLVGAGIFLTVRFFPLGALLAVPLFEAAASLARTGPDHRIGDVAADLLNMATSLGRPEVVEMLTRAILDGAQSDRRPTGLHEPDRGPWLVHGTRWEIADIFDYRNDCYRADSVEVFFPADEQLPDRVERLLAVFTLMRERNVAVGAYLSLRFHAGSRALLAAGPAGPVCAAEISMLRGLEGNTEALQRLQDAAVDAGGLVHWGQRNDLPATTVRRQFGERLRTWSRVLADLEGDSPTFDTPFAQAHGLRPEGVSDWTGWEEARAVPRGGTAVLSAVRGGLEVFAVDDALRVVRSRRPATGPASPWEPIRPEPVDEAATPVVVRGPSGRAEVFARAGDRLRHCWEEGRPGGPYSGWDTKGAFLSSGPRIAGDPAVAAHADGRLEAFALEFPSDGSRLLHTWAHVADGAWSSFGPLHDQPVTGAPSAARRGRDDGLVVAATDAAGTVVWTALGHGGWSSWQPLPHDGATLIRPLAVPAGGSVRLLAAGADGRAYETVQRDDDGWEPWRPLPEAAGPDRLDPSARLAVAGTDRLWLLGVTRRRRITAVALVPGSGWQHWIDLGGGDADGDPAAGFLEDGRVEVFVRRGGGGGLMARRQPAPDRW